MSRVTRWRLCMLAVLILSVISFTPLVIPMGEYRPMLAGIPITLWAGGLVAFALVALTYLAGLLHPEAGKDEEVKS